MSKFSKIAAGLAVMPVLALSAPAIADSPGQLTGGAPAFKVKNATQNGDWAANASAACNEEVKYLVTLHNAAFGGLTSIVVKSTLGASTTMTAVPAEGASAGTSGSVAVNLPANSALAYENGSTNLYDSNDVLIKNLADGIAGNGVNVGDLAGSTTEFVTFKAKVNCPTPPVTPPTQPKPTTLVNTGAGDVAGLFAVVTAAGAFGYRLFLGRRLSRQ